MQLHASGLGSVTQGMEARSSQGIIRFGGEVKHWPPPVEVARPAACSQCGQAAYQGLRVRLQGHGLVQRQQRGPVAPGSPPVTQLVACRRYRCWDCGAVMTVLPASAVAHKHFSGAAMALALTLWGLCGLSAAQVREAVSDWVHTGAAARGWRSLGRWARQVAQGKLFGALEVGATGSPREVAARAGQALCGWAPPWVRSQGLAAQAFAGACHVS